jgi:hypothetical protein
MVRRTRIRKRGVVVCGSFGGRLALPIRDSLRQPLCGRRNAREHNPNASFSCWTESLDEKRKEIVNHVSAKPVEAWRLLLAAWSSLEC